MYHSIPNACLFSTKPNNYHFTADSFLLSSTVCLGLTAFISGRREVGSWIIVYNATILLSNQKMALAMTPTQANLSSTFKLCLDFQQQESTIPIQLSFCSHVRISAAHREMLSSCHFCLGSPAFPLPGLVASSGQKQAKASLLPGQTGHLCPGGNPTQWL